jgi:hypothetical protein
MLTAVTFGHMGLDPTWEDGYRVIAWALDENR